jgi:Ca2+-transporting ATPase
MHFNPRETQKEFYALSPELVFEALETSAEGISDEEALRRRAEIGKNELPHTRSLPGVRILLRQVASPLILILIAAGTIVFTLHETVNAAFIFGAVIFNIALGFFQEYKADKALNKIKSYVRDRCVVIRSGAEREVDVSDLVIGDVIRLSQGVRIPADARIISATNVYADESILTGESFPEPKHAEPAPYGSVLPDRSSMVYCSTVITEGICHAVVTAIGIYTEIGKIAAAVGSQAEESTPLQKSITRFSTRFLIGVLGASVVLFVIGVQEGKGVVDMFLLAVAVAVAAVPEGLPITLTAILAVGVERLASRGGIVRKLLAAETLGNTTVILTDKTGTLTEARMELDEIIPFGFTDKDILKFAAANIDVVIENPHEEYTAWRMAGARPLESAVVRGAARLGIAKPTTDEELQALRVLPFNAKRKYACAEITVNKKLAIGFLGAPEILLTASRHLSSEGKIVELDHDTREDIAEEIDSNASQGKHVLGVALRFVGEGDGAGLREDFAPRNLVFAGIITIRDPLRAGAKDSIHRIQHAGVRVVLVTGDHQGTAAAVARELGFPADDTRVMGGEELDLISDEALSSRLNGIDIYARVSPAGKLKILKSFQGRGDIVAMTGDGVNDAPALKAADIGVAVGSGTDIARDVADLVLLDNNFLTIVYAIEEGRRIYHNVRKSVAFLLATSFIELVVVSVALLTEIPIVYGFFALQILWINMFSDSLPAVSFAFETRGAHSSVPKRRVGIASILSKQMQAIVFGVGGVASLTLSYVMYAMHQSGVDAHTIMTFLFVTIGVHSILYIFPIRSLPGSIFSMHPFKNWYVNGGVSVGLAMIVLGAQASPIQRLLGTVDLSASYWMGAFGFSAAVVGAAELVKYFFRAAHSEKSAKAALKEHPIA